MKTLRAIAYIDGFNLFYGCVKGTSYKWLDIVKLAEKLLAPYCELVEVKYFSAIVADTEKDKSKSNRQRIYIEALRNNPKVSIKLGYFSAHKVKLLSAKELEKGKKRLVEVIKLEEKGTDVNLAVSLVADAFQDKFDFAMVFSNDSDMAESLRIAREVCKKKIGLYLPPHAVTTKVLARQSDFIKTVRTSYFQNCQLPETIPGTNIKKPLEW